MRAVVCIFLLFALASATWSLQGPLSARHAIERLEKGLGDPVEQIRILREAGPSAVGPLRDGLSSGAPRVRLICARELLALGDGRGEKALFEIMRTRETLEDRALAGAAETYLLNGWAAENAPPPAERARAAQAGKGGGSDTQLDALTAVLERFPLWQDGYVQRARLNVAADRPGEARRDALLALYIQPDQFDAMVVLARAWSMLDRNDLAAVCLERAMTINPRFRESLLDEYRSLRRAMDLERSRQRREKRRNRPFA
jgi:tetratricopeptide (TPR) repeat protein